MTARRIALANNKGGVGKSTMTCRLAEEAAARGLRVLAVDGDPQGNLSRLLGWAEQTLLERATINEVVLAARPGCAADAIVPCAWDRLEEVPDVVHDIAGRIDLLPARYDYELRLGEAAGHAPGSAMARHARQRLAVALGGGLLDQYDVMFIDCPPSIGPLTQMALDAIADVEDQADAGGVVIPLYPDYDPIAGAVRMRDLIAAGARDWDRPLLRPRGVVVNRYDPSRKRAQQRDYLPYIHEVFDSLVLGEPLTERAVIAEVGSLGYPLRAEAPWRVRARVADLAPLVSLLLADLADRSDIS